MKKTSNAFDFNASINTGIFPMNQKLADVSPIFKDEDKHFKGNYRPVSILPAMSKISERLMSHQIEKYMTKKLSIYQCCFRNGLLTNRFSPSKRQCDV